MSALFACIEILGVVPVVAIESVTHAVPLADALLEGGLPMVEITFRTEAAAAVVARMTSERPDLLAGAGTILDPASIEIAKASGAAFGLSPGVDGGVVQAAKAAGLPFALGVTGGVTKATIGDWLSMPSALAVGGTWIARTEDIREERWAGITRRARAAVTAARAARERHP